MMVAISSKLAIEPLNLYVLSCILLLKTARYKQFRYKREKLWQTITRTQHDMVIERVWNHPINPGLLLGQLIGVPVGDILDTWY